MKFQVYRASASSYLDSKFLANEKKVLESIDNVEYIQSLQQYDGNSQLILITNTHTNPELFPQPILNKTALMVHPNSGFDNLTTEFIDRCKFPIVIGNPIRANAVVEYTLGCLFGHFTQIPQHHHWHEKRSWERKLVRDQKILLLGHGTIGKSLAQALNSIVNDFKVFDPNVPAQNIPYEVSNQWSDEILDQVSVLLFAASLNESSRNMLNSSNIKNLSSDCLIINPARGELIEEEALLNFLQKNPKSFAFLDVFSKEPFEPGFASQIKNLNKTSHIAGIHNKLNADIMSFEYLIVNDFVSRFRSNLLNEFQSEYSECLLNQEALSL